MSMPTKRTYDELEASVTHYKCELRDLQEKNEELTKINNAQAREIERLKREIHENHASKEIEEPESPILSPEKLKKQEEDGDETTDEADEVENMWCTKHGGYCGNGQCPN